MKKIDCDVAVIGAGPLAEALCRMMEISGVGRISFLASSRAAGQDRSAHDEAQSAEKAETFATDVVELDRGAIFADTPPDELPDLVIAAVTAHDPELMEAMDVFSKQHDVPWLLVRAIAQFDGWVGPLFIPHDTASYISFEARLRGNMQAYDEYDAFDRWARGEDARVRSVGAMRAYYEVLAGIAAVEVVKQLTGVTLSALAGKFVSVDLVTLETEVHEVLRFPRLEEESYSQPGAFPWKELPYDAPKTRRA